MWKEKSQLFAGLAKSTEVLREVMFNYLMHRTDKPPMI
jgi:hypothetical protein